MMSPTTALQSPIFKGYLIIVPSALLIGGAILAFVQYGMHKELGSIWATYRSWIVIAAIGLAVVFLGRAAVIGGVFVVSVAAFRELSRKSDLSSDRWLTGAVYLGIIAVAVASLVSSPHHQEPGAGWY